MLLTLIYSGRGCTSHYNRTNPEQDVLFLIPPAAEGYRLSPHIAIEIARLGYLVKPLPGILNDDKIDYGSGFFVSPTGTFLTNYHVIEKARHILLRKTDGQIIPARISIEDPIADIAVLVPEDEITVEHWIPLGVFGKQDLGTKITVLGYPFPQVYPDPKLSFGTVINDVGLSGDPASFQISAPVHLGSSGSPILNSRNEVIGIVYEQLLGMSMLSKTEPLPPDRNFGVKADYARVLVDVPFSNEGLSVPKKTISLAEAMDSTALVLVNTNSILHDFPVFPRKKIVLIDFSSVYQFEIICYTIMEPHRILPNRSTPQISRTGCIVGAPQSTPHEVTQLLLDQIQGGKGSR